MLLLFLPAVQPSGASGGTLKDSNGRQLPSVAMKEAVAARRH